MRYLTALSPVLLLSRAAPAAGDYVFTRPKGPVSFSNYRTECIPEGPTAACMDKRPVWDSLNYGFWRGMDCLLVELIEGVVAMGHFGVDEWIQTCAELALDQQGAKGPRQYFSTHIEGFDCPLPGNRSIVIEDVTEAFEVPTDPGACVPIMIKAEMEFNPCSEIDNVGLCNGENFDYTSFDTTMRSDCVARAFRDEFIQLGPTILAYYTAQCSQRRRLFYTDKCPGAMANKYQYSTEVYKLDCQASWHWRLHGNGDGVRGLSFRPLLKMIGSTPCTSLSCTGVQGSSCWPSPYFGSGPHVGIVHTEVYACPTSTDNLWHFSGNFRGTIYLQGSIVSSGSGGCVATTVPDASIRLSASTLSWCNVWIKVPIPYESVLDSQATQNVCL